MVIVFVQVIRFLRPALFWCFRVKGFALRNQVGVKATTLSNLHYLALDTQFLPILGALIHLGGCS